MIKKILIISMVVLTIHGLQAQGCVAIRGFGGCSVAGGASLALAPKQWQVGTNYRHFKSFRHFKGDEEQYDRLVKGTQVINYSSTMEISASYGLNTRWQLNIGLPMQYNDRSSYYEHGGNAVTGYIPTRRTSSSYGIGDARIGVSRWLWNPSTHTKRNIMLGASIKLPTGNFNAQDSFYNIKVDAAGTRANVYRPVDQSIQLGDGGVGLILDMSGFWEISHGMFLYANAFYLFNPRGVNGTRTYRETLNPILANEYMCSVPDQYAARLGFLWQTQAPGLSVSWGSRLEGIPVKDVLGESLGFRRPGYVVSAEPGVNYMRGKTTFNLNVPIALYRMRSQSVTDLQTQIATGAPRNGDAAFADYLVSFGITWRLSAPKAQNILGY